MNRHEALIYANGIIADLTCHCDKIEIAGSLRRGKPEVGDIEIVCLPRSEDCGDLFGTPALDIFYSFLDSYFVGKNIAKNGLKYKRIDLTDTISLDLFIVTPPAQWGVIFAIRTGPAEFSRKLVSPISNRGTPDWGFLPAGHTIDRGQLLKHGKLIPTETEKDFFRAINIEWIDPRERK
jgi:DNA polymerase/3'-5' exonuclease PolX